MLVVSQCLGSWYIQCRVQFSVTNKFYFMVLTVNTQCAHRYIHITERTNVVCGSKCVCSQFPKVAKILTDWEKSHFILFWLHISTTTEV